MDCPITREPIRQNDVFTFTTSNGKEIHYSARAIVAYINHSGTLRDPITREPLNHHHLRRLLLTSRSKSLLIEKFLKVWNVIANRGLRDEIEFKWAQYLSEPCPMSISTVVSFLLVIKACIGPFAYRSFINRKRRQNSEKMQPVEAMAKIVDSKIKAHICYEESRFSIEFLIRKAEDREDDGVKAMLEMLPHFEIRTLSSVTQSLMQLMRVN